VVQRLPSIHEVFGLIPAPKKKTQQKKKFLEDENLRQKHAHLNTWGKHTPVCSDSIAKSCSIDPNDGKSHQQL
jgi:hypothetical protein